MDDIGILMIQLPTGFNYPNDQKIGDEIMTREEAKELLPIMQAFAEGKIIKYKYITG